jgi:hypothetical protein
MKHDVNSYFFCNLNILFAHGELDISNVLTLLYFIHTETF